MFVIDLFIWIHYSETLFTLECQETYNYRKFFLN